MKEKLSLSQPMWGMLVCYRSKRKHVHESTHFILQESFSSTLLRSAISPYGEQRLSTCFSPLLKEQCLISKIWKDLLGPKMIILEMS